MEVNIEKYDLEFYTTKLSLIINGNKYILDKEYHNLTQAKYYALKLNKDICSEGNSDNSERDNYANNIEFWIRLKSFIQDVQVNDAMSEEEKEMILYVCDGNIKP